MISHNYIERRVGGTLTRRVDFWGMQLMEVSTCRWQLV